jgi:hypothetical protein
MPKSRQVGLYARCFPSAGTEAFAKSILGPFLPELKASHLSNQTHEFQEATQVICAVPHCMNPGHEQLLARHRSPQSTHVCITTMATIEKTQRLHAEKEFVG